MHPYIAVPAILALLWRAYSRNSLTPLGIVTAALTAIAHAIHPWSIFFALLGVFFLAGSAVTKVKHDVKARLTLSSSGSSGGEGPRTHVQVLANSGVASILVLLHCWQLRQGFESQECWPYRQDLLVVGIISNYAAVAADTFSSELGILSKSEPRLLTSPTLRKVPHGTNGGVTPLGTAAGFLGALVVALTSVVLLPFCSSGPSSISKFQGRDLSDGSGWSLRGKIAFVLCVTVWGGLGSLVDSFLGGWLQASVIDNRTGKVVEGSGGKKVLVASSTSDGKRNDGASRKVESGNGFLDNNEVNLLMAFLMSAGGMLLASYFWDAPMPNVV